MPRRASGHDGSSYGDGRGTQSTSCLKRRDKALRAPALGAFIHPVHKARLFRFGAGKAHLRAAFDTEQALKTVVAFGL